MSNKKATTSKTATPTAKMVEQLENAGKIDREHKAMLMKIKQLDIEANEMINKVKEKTIEFANRSGTMDRDYENKLVKDIHQLHADIIKKCQKKKAIADEAYEYIDAAIQRMDEARAEKNKEYQESVDPDANVEVVLPVENIVMAVNPHEPVYCTCNQVASDEMIACDSPTCKFEWFHYRCVGIVIPPAGSWICDDCTKQRDGSKSKPTTTTTTTTTTPKSHKKYYRKH